MVLSAIKRLVEALAFQGDPAAGRALAEPALARAQELGLDRLESGLIVALTVCTDALGDRVAGLQQSLHDLALNRRSRNRLNEAIALSNVGMSYLTFGAFAQARGYLNDALHAHRALGNRDTEGNTHSVLSELAWREGHPNLALEHARAASDIAVETGARLYQTDALWSLGNARLALGDFAGADDAFGRSYSLAREIGSGFQALNALDGRTRVALAKGDLEEAVRLIEELLRHTGDIAPAAGVTVSTDDTADSNPNRFAGAYEHLIRLTMFSVWSKVGDRRAGPLLAEAYERLTAEADRVRDSALRERFLTCIAEHREIRASAEHAAVVVGVPSLTFKGMDASAPDASALHAGEAQD
jgi:tetratricopeptide (TPR) repeat protein